MPDASAPPAARLAALLQAEQRRFLGFLTPRLGSHEAARDLLQSALLKAIERGESLREEESARVWFFRVLRNALVDTYRHGDAERRALEVHAREVAIAEEASQAFEQHVCACVQLLAQAVKPEYAAVVQAVDLQGQSITEYAATAGLSAGNARIRLHRARAAMGQRLMELCGTCCAQGCQDCLCEEPRPSR
ncbi:sigma-70 family RNA polymerase sigma factor [Myxococcus sp. Y35]|uniref:sigma-70 family RNA polymerase sigma factor n=1 Tax=Pseudomyxococcus flavus TaxID=3115648 RepID=UPI003CFA5ADA